MEGCYRREAGAAEAPSAIVSRYKPASFGSLSVCQASLALLAEGVSKLGFVIDFGMAARMGMSGFIEGIARGQTVPFPDRLEDWIDDDHLVRVVDFFVAELNLVDLRFVRAAHSRTGRPAIILLFCSSCSSRAI